MKLKERRMVRKLARQMAAEYKDVNPDATDEECCSAISTEISDEYGLEISEVLQLVRVLMPFLKQLFKLLLKEQS